MRHYDCTCWWRISTTPSLGDVTALGKITINIYKNVARPKLRDVLDKTLPRGERMNGRKEQPGPLQFRMINLAMKNMTPRGRR